MTTISLHGERLARDPEELRNRKKEEILSFCRHIAASSPITATCIYRQSRDWAKSETGVIQVLLVIHNFRPRLMNYVKVLDDSSLSVLAADEWVFERDVDKGFLGEALASELIFPYVPLTNEKYLHFQEVKLKKRLVLEMLESLVLDFPELSYSFYVEPQYFMHEAILTRARFYPPLMYNMPNLTKTREKEATEKVLCGYIDALEKLEREGVVNLSNGFVRLSKDFVDHARRRKARFTNLFKTGQRTLFASALGVFPQILTFLSQNKDLLPTLQKMLSPNVHPNAQVEDPENHVYIPTATGLVPLANRTDIQAFAREVLAADKNAKVTIESLGGILNDVFLVTTHAEGKETKVVVKRFRDWSNFKWFPLTLWSVGTRSFTVLGKSRLEKECATSQLLYSKGLHVPRLLHVSPPRRLIFMEYIEGEDLRKVVRRVTSSKNENELHECLQIIERVGELLAEVHALDMALGDTKPENMIIGKTGEVYMTDFEQASHNGDKAWDIAEFLYYAGHDISPFVAQSRVEQMAKAFLHGYLRAGGNVKTIKNAGNPKYTKVFSVFTFPHLMLILSNVCRNADKLERK